MDKASITRYLILIIAVINAVLNLIGYQTISNEMTNDIIAAISGVYFMYCGWKNQYLSKKGIAQKQLLKHHKLE